MQESSVMNILSHNIRRCLEAYNWTARDLCAQTGINEVNMSRILNGKEGVSLKRAAVIADALDVELSDLISKNFEIPATTA